MRPPSIGAWILVLWMLSLELSSKLDIRRSHTRAPMRQLFARRQKWLAESLVKIIAVREVFTAVTFGLRQKFDLDHVENNFTKVLAREDIPFLQDRFRHRAKLRQRMFPDTLQQFLAGDMPGPATVILFGYDFLRVVQRFANKEISVARVTRVFGVDLLESFFETDFLHFKVLIFLPPGSADERSGTL